MIRRALIIYCDNTRSGRLNGPAVDNNNFREFLIHPLGGNWYNNEICSLANPTKAEVRKVISSFFINCDYSIVIFTGHGFCNAIEDNLQYFEVLDGNLSILELKTSADRQTIIYDSCRGIEKIVQAEAGIHGFSEHRISKSSTRQIFENAVMEAEKGIVLLESASVNESSIDTKKGGAYIYSLLKSTSIWSRENKNQNVLRLDTAHYYAVLYMKKMILTNQNPNISNDKRRLFFPFAVKFTDLFNNL